MELGQNSHGATGAPLQDPCASAASAREHGHKRGVQSAVEAHANPGGSPFLEARTQSQSRSAGLGPSLRVRTQQPVQQLRARSQSPARQRVPPSPVRTPALSSPPRVQDRATETEEGELSADQRLEEVANATAAALQHALRGQAEAEAQQRQQQAALGEVRDVVEAIQEAHAALQEAHDELQGAHDELRLVVQREVAAREALVREVGQCVQACSTRAADATSTASKLAELHRSVRRIDDRMRTLQGGTSATRTVSVLDEPMDQDESRWPSDGAQLPFRQVEEGDRTVRESVSRITVGYDVPRVQVGDLPGLMHWIDCMESLVPEYSLAEHELLAVAKRHLLRSPGWGAMLRRTPSARTSWSALCDELCFRVTDGDTWAELVHDKPREGETTSDFVLRSYAVFQQLRRRGAVVDEAKIVQRVLNVLRPVSLRNIIGSRPLVTWRALIQRTEEVVRRQGE